MSKRTPPKYPKPPKPPFPRPADPPTDPLFSVSVPVRQPGRGVYETTPVLAAFVSTGTAGYAIAVAVDRTNRLLHLVVGPDTPGLTDREQQAAVDNVRGDLNATAYVIAMGDILQAVADEHERHQRDPATRPGPRRVE